MKKLTKEQEIEALKIEMETTPIETPGGKLFLSKLIHDIGVKNKVEYFNFIEKPTPKKVRTINNMTHIVDVTHDWGLIFQNGVQIRHIKKEVFDYCQAEIIRIR